MKAGKIKTKQVTPHPNSPPQRGTGTLSKALERGKGGGEKRKLIIAPVIQNRRARYDYEILQTVDAGLSLAGPEVKSIRGGNASLSDSFARIDKNELLLHNMYIAPYPYSREELDARRPRKLLLHKQEILKLSQAVSQKGLTLIPLRVHFRRGWAKVEIAIARSKKQFDKREKIRRRVSDLEMRNRT